LRSLLVWKKLKMHLSLYKVLIFMVENLSLSIPMTMEGSINDYDLMYNNAEVP